MIKISRIHILLSKLTQIKVFKLQNLVIFTKIENLTKLKNDRFDHKILNFEHFELRVGCSF